MPIVPSMRRLAPTRSLLAIVAVLTVGLFAVWTSSASAAGVLSTFTFTPSSLQAGGSPDLNAELDFTYPNGTDTAKNVTVVLPPGLLASLKAVTATCSSTQLTGGSCPAASQIGTGTAVTAGAPPITATTAFYLMPAPAVTPPAAPHVAGIGVTITPPAGVTAAPATGTVDIITTPATSTSPPPNQPELQMAITNLPSSVTVGSSSVPIQVAKLTLSLPGKNAASGVAFTRMPSSCSAATVSASVDTTATTGGTAAGTGTASLTPTGCSSLPFSPKLVASATKDSSDSGVKIVTGITQAANEAANSSVTLTVPATAFTANLLGAAPLLDSSTPVGTAVAESPLLPVPLSGNVYLVSKPNIGLSIRFPAPFALVLNGAINLGNNSVQFTNVPDVPLTALAVTISGGSHALFTTNCAKPNATLSGAFTGQNGTAASSAAPVTVAGCSAAKTPGAPTGSGSVSGVSHGKPKLSVKLTAGVNGAPKLSAATFKLPGGLSFIKAKLKKGVTVSGGKIKSVSLAGGKLTVTLKSATSSFTVKVGSSALKASSGLVNKVKKHKVKTLKLTASVKEATGASVTVTITLKVS